MSVRKASATARCVTCGEALADGQASRGWHERMPPVGAIGYTGSYVERFPEIREVSVGVGARGTRPEQRVTIGFYSVLFAVFTAALGALAIITAWLAVR